MLFCRLVQHYALPCIWLSPRKLAQDTSAIIIQLYTGIAGLITMSVALFIGSAMGPGILQISLPTASEWGLLMLLGAIACVGHLLLVHAFRFADASALAPFHYFEIIGAVCLAGISFLIFHPSQPGRVSQ